MVTKFADDTNLLWILKMRAAGELQQDSKPSQNCEEMRINRSRSVQ